MSFYIKETNVSISILSTEYMYVEYKLHSLTRTQLLTWTSSTVVGSVSAIFGDLVKSFSCQRRGECENTGAGGGPLRPFYVRRSRGTPAGSHTLACDWSTWPGDARSDWPRVGGGAASEVYRHSRHPAPEFCWYKDSHFLGCIDFSSPYFSQETNTVHGVPKSVTLVWRLKITL